MGRHYPSELRRLPATLEWAQAQDISALSDSIRDLAGSDLLAVGSGGSFVAAAYAALLHEAYMERLARASTPLEAVSQSPTRDTAALLLSAGGTNKDIRQAAHTLLESDYSRVLAVTTRPGAPLGQVLRYFGAQVHEFAVPGGRDGFLATNSLYGDPSPPLPSVKICIDTRTRATNSRTPSDDGFDRWSSLNAAEADVIGLVKAGRAQPQSISSRASLKPCWPTCSSRIHAILHMAGIIGSRSTVKIRALSLSKPERVCGDASRVF